MALDLLCSVPVRAPGVVIEFSYGTQGGRVRPGNTCNQRLRQRRWFEFGFDEEHGISRHHDNDIDGHSYEHHDDDSPADQHDPA